MAEVSFKEGLQDFCVKLYQIYAEGTDNIFLSPYSISAALLLTGLGADKETERQIRAALGAGSISKTEIHRQYKQLESALNAETSRTTSLSIANRIFTKLGLLVDESYKADSKKYYGSGIELLDFLGEPEKSRQHINKWVEDQTRGKIRDLVPSGAIGPLSLMVLVNAIYFKGKWLKPFEAYSTRKNAFHLTKSKQVTVDMMNGEERVKYVLNDAAGYSAVELPYRDGNIVMDFILPKEIEGLKSLEKQIDLKFMVNISNAFKQADRPEVILSIPKFRMETQYKLETALPHLGIVDMFDVKAADFSAMFPSTPDAFISDAIHKAFVEVDEEGTEAAAATAMMMMLGCAFNPERPKEFIADHPFIFMIRDTKSDTVLFIGRYVAPPS